MNIAFPHPPGGGGPGSFQMRFERELKNAGWNINYATDNILPDIIMVVGGTKRLGWLWKMKYKGVPIVYRLDGINWLHRKKKVGVKKYLLGETRNYLSQIIRSFLADHIIYQSHFVKNWWEKEGWSKVDSYTIIHNGVDLKEFRPESEQTANPSIICLEGNIDYSPYSIDLLNKLQERFRGNLKIKLFGGFEDNIIKHKLHADICYKGYIKRSEVPEVLNNGIFLSLDIHPACPNTVIEAMASGIPVVGFDTGSLKELVPPEAGKVVPYGSDPWNLDFPDLDALTVAIEEILDDWEKCSEGAREVAEQRYSFGNIFESYCKVLEEVL